MKLLEMFRRNRETRAADALGRYRQLLRRAGDPRPGDAEELERLATDLGLAPADIESDVSAMARLGELERNQSRRRDDAAIKADAVVAGRAAAEAQQRLKEAQRDFDAAKARLDTLYREGAIGQIAIMDEAETRRQIAASNPRVVPPAGE